MKAREIEGFIISKKEKREGNEDRKYWGWGVRYAEGYNAAIQDQSQVEVGLDRNEIVSILRAWGLDDTSFDIADTLISNEARIIKVKNG